MTNEQEPGQLELRVAEPADAQLLADLIHEAFNARTPVDPPAAALSETLETLITRMDTETGIIAEVDGEPAGALFLSLGDDGVAGLHRVSVLPEYRKAGVAKEMIAAAAELAADADQREVELLAREELPQVISWWERHSFAKRRRTDHGWVLGRRLPVRTEVPTAEAMQELGRRLASILRPGDLIIASGELGAGKTTFTQGLGDGLGVEGPVISPTFVLSRMHESKTGGLGLIHVDAYRLGSAAELEDLDLETVMSNNVTLVEWGDGLAEGLNSDRLFIEIVRSDDPADDTRTAYLDGMGERWNNDELAQLVGLGEKKND